MYMVIIFCIAAVSTVTTAVLAVKLRTTQQELRRTQLRMQRLDAIADDVARRETEATYAHVDVEESADVSFQPRTPPPPELEAELAALRDSGKFQPIGLQLDSEDVFDEDDFAAPRMAPTMRAHAQQKPSRERYETPVASPRALMPPHQPQEALVAVGSISVRSDYGSPQPQQKQ